VSWAVSGAGDRENESGRWIRAAARRREDGRKQSAIESEEGSYAIAELAGADWGWWGAAGWREFCGERGAVGAVRTTVESPQPRPASSSAY